MSDYARLLADARARWDADVFDPASPSAQSTVSHITSSSAVSVPARPNRTPRRLAAAAVVGAAALSAAAITIPGAAPDVIAQAASAYRSSVGEGITFSGELRYGNDSNTGNVIRVEGSQKGALAALVVRGEMSGGLEERTSLGSRLALFQVALPELRELLERASAGEDDPVRVAGETTVAGRPVYELQMDLPEGGSWTLYVDRENYRPVRFEQVDPSGSWATLDFVQFERMNSGE